MKKIISIILLLALLSSVCLSIPFNALAASEQYLIDFNSAVQSSYPGLGSKVSVIDYDSAHGKVMKITQMRSSEQNYMRAVFSVPKEDYSSYLSLQSNKEYQMTFEYLPKSTPLNYTVYLYGVKENQNFAQAVSDKVVLASFTGVKDTNNWQTQTFSFTTNPNYPRLAIALRTASDVDTEVYIDNISIIDAAQQTVQVLCHHNNGLADTIYNGIVGSTIDLVPVVPEGYVFDGWFSDDKLTHLVNKLSADTTEVWASYKKDCINFKDAGKFYNSNGKHWNSQCELTTDPTPNSNHGEVLKFKRIRPGEYFDAISLPKTDYSDYYEFTKDRTYRITFDFLEKKADTNYSIYIYGVDKDLNLAGAKGVADLGNYLAKITPNNTYSEWNSISADVKIGDRNKVIISIRSDTSADLTNQELFIDNISIVDLTDLLIKGIYDGSQMDVKYHYNDGIHTESVIEKAYIGCSYGYPERDNYTFAGWYMDEELTFAAPNTVRNACEEVYAKWIPKKTVPDSTVITFDDSNSLTYYSGTNISGTHTSVVDSDDPEHGNAIKLTRIGADQLTANRVPSIFRLGSDADTKNFTVSKGARYNISFDYKVVNTRYDLDFGIFTVKNASNVASTSNITAGYNNKTQLGSFSSSTFTGEPTEWFTVENSFVASDDGNLTITVSNKTLAMATANNDLQEEILIDNIRVEEIIDVRNLHFESLSADAIDSTICAVGYEIPETPIPVKTGYRFVGWFTDMQLTVPFRYYIMPNKSITLYAKYEPILTEAMPFETSFEKEDYTAIPYFNIDKSDIGADNTMNESATWQNNSNDAQTGKAYMELDNTKIQAKADSQKWMAFSLVNKDGSIYQLISGKRYRISFAFRAHMAVSGYTMMLCTTSQVPGRKINKNNATKQIYYNWSNVTGGTTETWYEYEGFFEASESKNAVFAAYIDYNGESGIDIDNLTITPMSDDECIEVKYINKHPVTNEESIARVTYSKPGYRLTDASTQQIKGYTFNGWRDKDGKVYTSSKFPDKDLVLYSSYVVEKDLSKAKAEWGEYVEVDFEDTLGAKIFYGDKANSHYPLEGVSLVTEEPEKAHTGNNYLEYHQAGHWTTQYLRKARFYLPDSYGNQLYLEPNSVYKVSYWMYMEGFGGSSAAVNLYLVNFFDKTVNSKVSEKDSSVDEAYEILAENYLTESAQFPNIGKWLKKEMTIVTGNDEDGDGIYGSLGFVLYAGYLSARIDDISVRKLKEVTVEFESNGGDAVNPVSMMSYDYLIPPKEPKKDGYAFGGWYSDKSLKNKFDFNNTLITENTTLYALWVEEENATKYKTITEYIPEQYLVDVTPDDADLDNKIIYKNIDKIKTVKSDDVKSLNKAVYWIIAGAVVLVAVIGLLVFMIVRYTKRRKRSM